MTHDTHIPARQAAAAIALTAIVSLANIASLGFLIHEPLYSGATLHGRQLLSANPTAPRDFAFPQMTGHRGGDARLAPSLRRLLLRLVHERQRVQRGAATC